LVIAVYPGSFDPLTCGHLDIIERATKLFDEVVVAISKNVSKHPLFTTQERLEMLREVLTPFKNIRLDSFDGLTVNYALARKIQVIIRGLRAISDFESEFSMALINKKLAPSIDTVFLMTRAKYSYISSSGVKEIASCGGCITNFVPFQVEQKIINKFVTRKQQEGF